MRVQHVLQDQAVQPQDGPRALDVSKRPLKGWRSVKQLARDLDFVTTAPGNPEKACRAWLTRHGIVSVRRGRVILVDGLDVDRVLRHG